RWRQENPLQPQTGANRLTQTGSRFALGDRSSGKEHATLIQSTSAMDRPVNRKRAVPRRAILAAALPVPLALGLTRWRPVTRWFSAERTIDAKRLRTADVVRGDL